MCHHECPGHRPGAHRDPAFYNIIMCFKYINWVPVAWFTMNDDKPVVHKHRDFK